jgi:N-acyl-D-aspartate/D-glutamate deacylase
MKFHGLRTPRFLSGWSWGKAAANIRRTFEVGPRNWHPRTRHRGLQPAQEPIGTFSLDEIPDEEERHPVKAIVEVVTYVRDSRW